MSQSLTKIFTHIIFHSQSTVIDNDVREEMYSYMSAIIKDNDSVPIIIGGMPDHIHILCILSKNLAIAKLVEELKRHSSRWIKGKGGRYVDFKWQGGYAAFSVSPSIYSTTVRYINNQAEHHKRVSCREELITFFEHYGVQYDERYLLSE